MSGAVRADRYLLLLLPFSFAASHVCGDVTSAREFLRPLGRGKGWKREQLSVDRKTLGYPFAVCVENVTVILAMLLVVGR